ncbi:MAG: zf-TFIIB domain-containing protein [Fibrobacteria bacterium]|nr:zf-TFIIB domain-containing protein [Fibrobacteria bacterium]
MSESIESKLENYFQMLDRQKLKELREQHLQESASKEKEELKNLHYMHCPKCGTKMEPIMMHNIEIDKCPDCLGIYFDNSELEQLLEIEFDKRRTLVRKIFGLK